MNKYKFLGMLFHFIYRALSGTTKKEYYYEIENFDMNSQNIVVFWHRKIFTVCNATRIIKKKASMVSASKDGEILSELLRREGNALIRGSSNRDNIKSLKESLRYAKDGYALGIAIDGPKGPIFEPKAGAIYIAQKTGLPIVPVSSYCNKKWIFENYHSVLQSGDFLMYFVNSILVTAGSLFFIILFGAMASYALVNLKNKITGFLYFFFIAGMMLPIKIGSIRLLQMIKALGLLNSIAGLYPIYIAMGIPIAVFILTEFIGSIPKDLTEAGLIDGASRMTIFRKIIFPIITPAIATVSIYNLVPIWNDLWFPLIFITDERSKTLLLGVTRLFGQYLTDWSKILAVLTLSAVPVILLYLMMSRHFISGLTAGAVKG